VHDARIATFGERVEDIFLISDQHDQSLSEDTIGTMRTALIASLEGEQGNDAASATR
jgi:[protein-PII] uridylyltransferase